MNLQKNILLFASIYTDSIALKAYEQGELQACLWEEVLPLGTAYSQDMLGEYGDGVAEALGDFLSWRLEEKAARTQLFLQLEDVLLYQEQENKALLPKERLEQELLRPLLRLGASEKVFLKAITELAAPELLLQGLKRKGLKNYLPDDYFRRRSLQRADRLCRRLYVFVLIIFLGLCGYMGYVYYQLQQEGLDVAAVKERVEEFRLWEKRQKELQALEKSIEQAESTRKKLQSQNSGLSRQLGAIGGGFSENCWLEALELGQEGIVLKGYSLDEEALQDNNMYSQAQTAEQSRDRSKPLGFTLVLKAGVRKEQKHGENI